MECRALQWMAMMLSQCTALPQKAINRARTGGGPTLIECKTYRWYGHSEIDPAKYRDPADVEAWKQKTLFPIWKTQWRSSVSGHRNTRQQIVDDFNKELEAAVDYATNAPGQNRPMHLTTFIHSASVTVEMKPQELDTDTRVIETFDPLHHYEFE